MHPKKIEKGKCDAQKQFFKSLFAMNFVLLILFILFTALLAGARAAHAPMQTKAILNKALRKQSLATKLNTLNGKTRVSAPPPLYLTVGYCPTLFSFELAVVVFDIQKQSASIVNRIKLPQALANQGCDITADPIVSFDRANVNNFFLILIFNFNF